MQRIRDVYSSWAQFFATKRGARIRKTAHAVMLVAIVAYLAYEFTEIGWDELYRSLPTHPLFYVFFALIYLSLPLTESLMYRLTWRYPVWKSLPMYLKKRVYNQQVVGYSGEVYFFMWARDRVDGSPREIALTIKDNNIVSSIASAFVAASLLAGFVLTGQVMLDQWVGSVDVVYVAIGALILLALIGAGIKFRKYLFSLPSGVLWGFFAIHIGRLLLNNVLQVGQWYVILPDVSLSVWFTFLAALIVIQRIPLPNRDLLFVGAGVELAGALGIPSATVAGMLLVNSVLQKVIGFALFLLVSLSRGEIPEVGPTEEIRELTSKNPPQRIDAPS